jgi:hypothetical protein
VHASEEPISILEVKEVVVEEEPVVDEHKKVKKKIRVQD